MTRKLSIALAALLLGVGCPGCPDATGNKTTPASDTILLGEYESMSGAEATFGDSTHKGILLALDEINKAGGVKGKKVEVKVLDDKGNEQEAQNCVLRLCTEDKVTALLGEVASSRSIAGGRVAQKNGVPMVSPSSTNATVTKIGDMIFRVCFIDDFQGFVGAKFAYENLKAKKMAILYDQTQPYSAGLREDFKKAFTGMGGAIVEDVPYNGGDTDFSAQLNKIKAASPDAVYVPGYYTEGGNIALQARKLDIKVPLIGGDGWDSPKLAEIAKEAIEGCYYSNHYSEEEQRPEVQEFVKKFKEKNPSYPADGLAALGYDAAKLLCDALGRAASLSGKDIAAALASTKDFKGVTGIITIDAERNARKPAVMLAMKDGKPHYVATVAPSN
jgi:branched-chain amino acid transport system substrate-binding protein